MGGSQRVISWIGILAGLGVITGALCALVWARLVHLPAYVVDANHFAQLNERGQAEIIAADAWFVVIGLGAGLLLGSLAWSWFKGLGWPVALIATGIGLLAGLVCWGIGPLFGPSAFELRLAEAAPGDSVVIAFRLHAPVALAAWGLAAVAPSLFLAALGPELPDAGDRPGPRGRAAAGLPDAEAAPVAAGVE